MELGPVRKYIAEQIKREVETAKADAEKALAELPMHTTDSQCTIDPATGCCVQCGVDHSALCPACKGRGFHDPNCQHWLIDLFNQGE
jgi:hypothetical protein